MTEPASTSNRTPTRGADAFECPRCDAFAHQEWFTLMRERHDEYNEWTEPASDDVDSPTVMGGYVAGGLPWPTPPSEETPSPTPAKDEVREDSSWAMAQCGRCRRYSTWRGDRMMFPTGSSLAPKPHADMPEEARALYAEAAEVVGISRRAGAALARASLERALRTLDPMTGRPDLAKRIEHVLDRVSESLGEMLTVIRHAGNKSLHVEDQPDEVMVLVLNPDEAEVVELIFESINDLVDELVTRPARKREVFDKLPPSVRESMNKAKRADKATPPAG